MSLSQLHAAIFSLLIATLDSIECVLEGVSFSELSVFLELLFVNVFAGTSSGSVIVSSVPSVTSLSVPVSSLSLPRFEVHTS